MQNNTPLFRYCLMLVLVFVLACGFMPTSGYGQGPELLPQTRSFIHLQALGIFIGLYADKHNGKYPESWAELSRSGVIKGLPPDLGDARYETADGKQRLAWLYFPGASKSSPPTTIIAASPVAADDPKVANMRTVLYADLKVKRVPDAEYHDQLTKRQATHPSSSTALPPAAEGPSTLLLRPSARDDRS